MSVNQYLNPPAGQKPWAEGDWVCIEGNVTDTGELFGASLVSLGDTKGMDGVGFEGMGYNLRGVKLGMNIVVRGRITSRGIRSLAESSFVTQEQITEALASAERGAATGSK
ncbi:MAG: hypothetical protein DWH81_09150 [Planctomycetota bacterium]|jgi:hypothetical protein|nr:MAG: hypothetical protein DWH81_09150 [Planctomycetota bacterium]